MENEFTRTLEDRKNCGWAEWVENNEDTIIEALRQAEELENKKKVKKDI